MIKNLFLVGATFALSACAGPQVTRVQPLSESADAPYNDVLVISLFKSFDARRYLEKEIVSQLKERGVNAIASTSMMDTRTPVTRETFLEMVESQGSDAVLVTQLVNLDTKAKMKDSRPEATYKVGLAYSSFYYNMWDVQLVEYVEPQIMELKHSIALATQVFSVASKEPVWTIESVTKLKYDSENRFGGTVIADEARSIVSYLSRDGLLAP